MQNRAKSQYSDLQQKKIYMHLTYLSPAVLYSQTINCSFLHQYLTRQYDSASVQQFPYLILLPSNIMKQISENGTS